MSETVSGHVDDREGIAAILRNTRTIAVIGMKPDTHSFQPAHYVPSYLKDVGYDVIPVPVYYPDCTEILGISACRSLDEIDREIDLALVFRRPVDVPKHRDEILAAKPKAVWMQSGISHAETAEALVEAGIAVVQDRCIMIEHRFAQ